MRSELEFRYKVAGGPGQVDKDKEEVVQGCRLPRTGSLGSVRGGTRLQADQDM